MAGQMLLQQVLVVLALSAVLLMVQPAACQDTSTTARPTTPKPVVQVNLGGVTTGVSAALNGLGTAVNGLINGVTIGLAGLFGGLFGRPILGINARINAHGGGLHLDEAAHEAAARLH